MGRAWETLWLYVLRLCFLGFLAESPDDMQQTVGRDDVVECLRASLSVDVSSDVGEIAQDVESVEEEGEVALGYAFRQAGIPDELVGVHAWFAISSSAVHGQVGRHLDVPWQAYLGSGSILEG